MHCPTEHRASVSPMIRRGSLLTDLRRSSAAHLGEGCGKLRSFLSGLWPRYNIASQILVYEEFAPLRGLPSCLCRHHE